MVSQSMRRYRQQSSEQARLIREPGDAELDLGELFGREAPCRLEVGFGHGRFLSQIAASHPDEHCIGVEHNPLRVNKTAQKSLDLGVENVRLFHDEAYHFLRCCLPPASLHRAYVLFSDPWPKQRHRRRRLINRAFLLAMSRVMQPGGRLIISSDTHNYAMGVLSHISTLPGLWHNAYANGYRMDLDTRFPTVFEEHKRAEGCSICYLAFVRSEAPCPPLPPFRASPFPSAML